jgi:hypothetical protein
MDIEQEFSKILQDKGLAGAEPWIEEWVRAHPWDQHAKGCRTFIYALKKYPLARTEVEEVLALSPFNEWALVALFLLDQPCEEEEMEPFMGWNGFRLDPIWIAILWVLGFHMDSFMLWLTFRIYGTDEQKVVIERDYKDLPDLTIAQLDKENEAFIKKHRKPKDQI